jgi:hypothetical protein
MKLDLFVATAAVSATFPRTSAPAGHSAMIELTGAGAMIRFQHLETFAPRRMVWPRIVNCFLAASVLVGAGAPDASP